MRSDKMSKLIGKRCYVTDKNSIYYNEWGIIKLYDGEFYHVAIANGTDSMPIFDRQQIKISRNQSEE